MNRLVDRNLAREMWIADKRPCAWEELDEDEQAEWVVMAKAARLFVEKRLRNAILSATVPRSLGISFQDADRLKRAFADAISEGMA
ncbi:MAG TPA: hypothetical protein VGN97_12300 [Mesorhizobium sp.]|jgi:hypothetical protein|nr:hypothetical protein [Mesorhizobium sp.]